MGAAGPEEMGSDPVDNDGGAGGQQNLGAAGAAGGTAGSSTKDASVTQTVDAGSSQMADSGNSDAQKPVGSCGYLFCEDFETSEAIDPKVWTVRKDNKNAVTLDTANVAHGKRSVKFHAAANSRLAMIFAKLVSPDLRQHLWGRAYFLVTPQPPAGHTAFVTAGTMDGYPFSDDHQEISGYYNSWQLGFWGNGEIISAGGKIPLKTWACIEWEMNNDAGNLTVYVNGTKSHVGAGYGKNKIATGFTDVAFGFRSWHPANHDVDISMDDIAIDKIRVGCLPQ